MSARAEADEGWQAMQVKGLLIDPTSETPVLLLQSSDGSLLLPIWIGRVEANAIAGALEGIREPRPMTHDLIHAILVELSVELVRVEVWALREGTYLGRLRLRQGDVLTEIDSRPSDAIAMAVRTGAPIWVAQTVLEEALQRDLAMVGEEEERLREWLEKARPEDLGKYTM